MKRILLSLVLALGLGMFALAPIATAQQDQVIQGVCLTDPNPTLCQQNRGNADAGINNIIRTVIIILQVVAGVVAVIMIIIAGLRYVLSGGDAGKVASAKNAIVYALVGVVVVVMAQILITFVFNRINQTANPTPAPAAPAPAP